MKHQSPASRHAWNPTEKEDWNVHGVELGYKNSWKMTPIQRMTSVVSLSLNIFHPIIINNNKKCKICCVQLEAWFLMPFPTWPSSLEDWETLLSWDSCVQYEIVHLLGKFLLCGYYAWTWQIGSFDYISLSWRDLFSSFLWRVWSPVHWATPARTTFSNLDINIIINLLRKRTTLTLKTTTMLEKTIAMRTTSTVRSQ